MSGDLLKRTADYSRYASHAAADTRYPRSIRSMAWLAVLSTCLYGLIAHLSWRFDYGSVTIDRPIITVLILFAAAFAAYLWSVRVACRAPQNHALIRLIAAASVTFRAVMLFSVPIQEIDIYRYLWDGAVCTTGVSPFRYNPQQVREANVSATSDASLRKLVELRDGHAGLAEALRRVHFGELPTVYPPASQAVFATAAASTPPDASVFARVVIMKAWLITFDLLTFGLLIALLQRCRKPVGLSVLYGWCPLLVKEVANSGHLDSIAVFFSTLAVYLVVRQMGADNRKGSWFVLTSRLTMPALVLAAAVGAKLYPIILAPLIFLFLGKRIGWRYVPIPALIFALTTLLILQPMIPTRVPASAESEAGRPQSTTRQSTIADSVVPIDPSRGIKTFLRRWEMNDFVFMLLFENLKPAANLPPGRVAWFSIVPESLRGAIAASIAERFPIDRREVPFLLTRAITGIASVALALSLAWRAAQADDPSRFCESGFLTLAWFWLLCPTQNPWYWTWTLPLLPFGRAHAWRAMSGLVMLYYLRFWLSYHWPDHPVPGTPYVGYAFFDFVVTWIEFAPWLCCLGLEYALRKRGEPSLGRNGTSASTRTRLHAWPDSSSVARGG